MQPPRRALQRAYTVKLEEAGGDAGGGGRWDISKSARALHKYAGVGGICIFYPGGQLSAQGMYTLAIPGQSM